jgi:hypothetical protein
MARILLDQRAGEAGTMRAVVKTVSPSTRRRLQRGDDGIDTTLLELVQAVARNTSDEGEIVATVRHLLRTGRVRLIGNFRGRRLDVA